MNESTFLYFNKCKFSYFLSCFPNSSKQPKHTVLCTVYSTVDHGSASARHIIADPVLEPDFKTPNLSKYFLPMASDTVYSISMS